MITFLDFPNPLSDDEIKYGYGLGYAGQALYYLATLPATPPLCLNKELFTMLNMHKTLQLNVLQVI